MGPYLWRYTTYGTITKKSIRHYKVGHILKYGNTIRSTGRYWREILNLGILGTAEFAKSTVVSKVLDVLKYAVI
jgi:hypothetical protein